MATEDAHDGGCICGQVRYRAVGEVKIAGVCHCRYCQVRAGSAFGVLAYFAEDDGSVLSGELKPYAFTSESDKAWENQFCGNCGTTIFMRLEVFPGWVGIAAGTFDPPAFWFDLNAEVFTRSKASFVGEIEAKDHSPTFFSYDPKNPEASRLIGLGDT